MRSRERASALKRDGYCCQGCGCKQSRAKGHEFKVEVHHLDGVRWDEIVEYIYRHLLCDPSRLEVMCPACHEAEHKGNPDIVLNTKPRRRKRA